MSTLEQPEELGRPPESLWRRLRAEPERAPEHIASAAAERFGPQAARWVERERGRRRPDRLARVAYRKHVRLSRLEGAALGLGGLWTAAADVVALLWIQSRMVFYIAAAYGHDPCDPMRPAELLVLQGVYPSPAEARAALDGIGTPLARALVEHQLRDRDEAIFSKLIRYAGRKATERAAGRLVPLISSPISAVQNAAATKDLGRRALRYYRRD